MAFTDHTWAFQEEATSANLNLLRDNFRLMGPHLIVRKTSDESVTSSTVLQNDDELLMALAANEVWRVEFLLLVIDNSSGTADFKLAFTFPAGATCSLHTVNRGTTGTAANDEWFTTSGAGVSVGASNVVAPIQVAGVIVNGGTPGNLTLQWAQSTSSGSSVVVKANSTLWGVKLA